MMEPAANVRIIPANPKVTDRQKQYHQLRVAAYCRVSTEMEEQQNSYQVQIEYYTEKINQNKEWTLAGIFADEGISGTSTAKRTEFNRMIRMCKQKKIDLILTKSISRFARNTVDCLEYIRMLKSLGIGVIFEKENFNSLTMTSEFLIALFGSFAQAESESISKNVTLGNQMAFKSGKARIQYRGLLGYRRGSDGKPVIEPTEAETVRRIFMLFLEGGTIRSIAEKMIAGNRLTAQGDLKWTATMIRRILHNEKYVGDVLMQKTYTLDCITHKSVKNNGERAMYLIQNNHPAIIDRDTYNRVQQELKRRVSKRKTDDKTKTETGKYSGKYALTEIMICGECGTAFRRVVWRQTGTPKPVWRCLNRLNHGSKYCHDSPTLHEELLHRAVVRAINEYYDCSAEIRRILAENVQTVMAGSAAGQMQEIQKRLQEIDAARNDLICMIASGGYDEDSMDETFAQLHAEEQELTQKLETLQAQSRMTPEQEQQMQTVLAEITDTDFRLTEYDDALTRKLIECIKVKSKTEITVIFKGGYAVDTDILP